jgi:hypothetical protein
MILLVIFFGEEMWKKMTKEKAKAVKNEYTY